MQSLTQLQQRLKCLNEAKTRRIKEANNSLLAFANHTMPSYKPAEHHRLIADALERVERGECDRLMIFMPPRHGKSELASIRFPAWYMGRNPTKSIIAASYNSALASDFGEKVRDILRDEPFEDIFEDVQLKEDTRAKNKWRTKHGGSYYAVGVNGSLTGRGANLLLIDDPIKDRKTAESEIERKNVIDWFSSAAFTRLEKGGAIVIIQTRWHEEDLSGYLLDMAKETGDEWEVISLPALDPLNNPLWPEKYSLDQLERIKRMVLPSDWNALYMQNPMPTEGVLFKRAWLRYYTREDIRKLQELHSLRIYMASDYAVSEDTGDYCVHGVFGVDEDDNIYVLDWYRAQADTLTWTEAALDMAEDWKPMEWLEEAGVIARAAKPIIDKRSQERHIHIYRNAVASTSNKVIRAQSIRGRIAQGKVLFPKSAPWVNALVSELLSFPNGKYDDQVDVLSLMGQFIGDMLSGELKDIAPHGMSIRGLMEQQVRGRIANSEE